MPHHNKSGVLCSGNACCFSLAGPKGPYKGLCKGVWHLYLQLTNGNPKTRKGRQSVVSLSSALSPGTETTSTPFESNIDKQGPLLILGVLSPYLSLTVIPLVHLMLFLSPAPAVPYCAPHPSLQGKQAGANQQQCAASF